MVNQHQIRVRLAAFAFCLALGLSSLTANAEDIANFWISNQDNGPEAPVIQVLAGSNAELEIWARPAAEMTLSAFSLNLVATDSAALDFQSIDVHNPTASLIPQSLRHQLVFDTSQGLSIGPTADYLAGFSGLSLLDGAGLLPDGSGLGPSCSVHDMHCSNDSGADSWRIATVDYLAGAVGTTTDLYLEISSQGLWHAGGTPTDSSAVFGLPNDTIHRWSTTGGTDNRDIFELTAPNYVPVGAVDAVIQVVSRLDADFNEDALVDGIDLLSWQGGFGSGITLAEGDANGDLFVDAADLMIWHLQYGTPGAATAVSASVPEPATLVLLVMTAFAIGRSRATF
ncbi:hypothetical protein [Adhaeretor mobilis]|uniref:PEP-CTERM protein-sorting domain-containing protein n=1 Tax=Adhaeretor mobilis TaxID=1930276 RepID=A0A517MQ52_9BACT|nr:hypothetical protein [Adhaeretor mobilis]QDS97015.1 hypothetical protein HG15A2_02740 [Adhaeretor mobilis]